MFESTGGRIEDLATLETELYILGIKYNIPDGKLF